MKHILTGLAAASLVAVTCNLAAANTTTVVRHETAFGHKTIVKHENGAKTIIKRHMNHVKKIHIEPNGDKTVVKKTEY
ncbi:MAG: hypothetical protein JO256_12920 [Alphaproteobacteria bacterium]|nr:hypothetical protein [Alphaproteobacteria bacterium]